MKEFRAIIETTLEVMRIPFTVLDFEVSFWQIWLFLVFGGLTITFIGGLFD
ncbi:MAG: hypothetical protein FWE90_08265 [Defluviitaleaceae bacterium]|nr:hypothetical protein [Defluviitaleaceae bacterium]